MENDTYHTDNTYYTEPFRLLKQPAAGSLQRFIASLSFPSESRFLEGTLPAAADRPWVHLLLQEVTGSEKEKEVLQYPAGRVSGVSARPDRINTPATGTMSPNECTVAAPAC